MQYRAEVYHPETEELVASLGDWQNLQTAQRICVDFQPMPLSWVHPWKEQWQARSNVYWYRVIAVAARG